MTHSAARLEEELDLVPSILVLDEDEDLEDEDWDEEEDEDDWDDDEDWDDEDEDDDWEEWEDDDDDDVGLSRRRPRREWN